MFKFSKLAAAAAIAVSLTATAASAITMTISGGTLGSGGTLSGSFDYVGGTISNVSLTTTAGTGITFSQTYNGGSLTTSDVIAFTGTSTSGGVSGLLLTLSGTTLFADLEAQTVTSASLQLGSVGVFGLIPSYESVQISGAFQARNVTGGLITVPAPPPAIPLPAGAPLLVAGLGALALLRKKRKS